MVEGTGNGVRDRGWDWQWEWDCVRDGDGAGIAVSAKGLASGTLCQQEGLTTGEASVKSKSSTDDKMTQEQQQQQHSKIDLDVFAREGAEIEEREEAVKHIEDEVGQLAEMFQDLQHLVENDTSVLDVCVCVWRWRQGWHRMMTY